MTQTAPAARHIVLARHRHAGLCKNGRVRRAASLDFRIQNQHRPSLRWHSLFAALRILLLCELLVSCANFLRQGVLSAMEPPLTPNQSRVSAAFTTTSLSNAMQSHSLSIDINPRSGPSQYT